MVIRAGHPSPTSLRIVSCPSSVIQAWGPALGPREIEKESSVGDGLLSHAADRILPWALAGLTAGFEMGPGGPPPLRSPTELSFWRV